MIKIEDCHNLTNKVLLAIPSMNNYRFGNSVIYICEHDTNGAIGLIINKKINSLSLKDLIENGKGGRSSTIDNKDPLYFGGPIGVGRGFVLHSMDKSFKGTAQLSHYAGLTSTVDILNAITEKKGPEKFLVMIGFMKWGYGELESEIKQNYWIVQESSSKFIFDTPPTEKWSVAMKKFGISSCINVSTLSGNA